MPLTKQKVESKHSLTESRKRYKLTWTRLPAADALEYICIPAWNRERSQNIVQLGKEKEELSMLEHRIETLFQRRMLF